MTLFYTLCEGERFNTRSHTQNRQGLDTRIGIKYDVTLWAGKREDVIHFCVRESDSEGVPFREKKQQIYLSQY